MTEYTRVMSVEELDSLFPDSAPGIEVAKRFREKIETTPTSEPAPLHTSSTSDVPSSGIMKKPRRSTGPHIPVPLPETPDAMRSVDGSQIEVLSGMDRMKEVKQRIMAADGLQDDQLHKISIQSNSTKIIRLEYERPDKNIAYLYLDKECHKSHYSTHTGAGRQQFDLDHPNPGTTVLLRVIKGGSTEEIYRWAEGKDSE